MNNLLLNEKKLMQTGVFTTRMEMIDYILLKIIKDNDGPLGSWTLREEINDYGISCSTATIGRYLKELDYKGYTIQKGNQGRVLTLDGSFWVDEIENSIENAIMHKQLTLDIQITEYDELIDLLNVRKTLETEATRLAAINATDDEIRRLFESLEVHRKCVEENLDPTNPALDFHNIIAEICHNKFILALLNVLIFEEKRIESVFPTLITRERGVVYVQEHDKITKAIEARNPREAAKLMNEHIQVLIEAIIEQAYDK